MVQSWARRAAGLVVLASLGAWVAGPRADEAAEGANLLFDFSRAFIDAGLGGPADSTRPVQESDCKYQIEGVQRTRSQAHAELIPNAERAAVDLVTPGVIETASLVTMSSIRLWFRDVTPFEAHKVVVLDADGFHDGPSCVRTSDTNALVGMNTGHHGMTDRVLKRAICRRYHKGKEDVEQYVAKRGAEGILEEQNKQVAEELRKANDSLTEGLRENQKRGLVFRSRRYSTTTDFLRVAYTANTGGRAPAMAPPPPVPGTPYAALRIHESLVNHRFAVKYGGEKYTGEQMNRLAQEWLKAVGGGAPPPADGRDWSLTLAQTPVVVHFQDHGFELALHSSGFTSGDTIYPAMSVTARYRFVVTPEGVRAVRQGDLRAYPPGFGPGSGKKLNARQQAMAAVFERRFEKVFQERLEIADIPLPGDARKQGPLVATSADGSDGWLLLTWRHGQSPDAAAPPCAP
jgi:hypothetical protein